MAAAQPPNLYFKKINTGNGLSHNKVNCIVQDKRGFTWIGTDDGLNRYDGNNFLIFRNTPGSATGISGNIITGLLEDEKGILWITTSDGGLTRYDYRLPATQQFKQFKNKPGDKSGIPVNIINALVQDEYGFLWLATSGKRVIRFNKQSEKFDEPVTTGTATALALCLDNNKNIWVGRQGGGLLKVHTQSLQLDFDKQYSNLYAKLPHVVVTSLFMDSDKNIWYGSWDKVLYKYNITTGRKEVFQESASPFLNDEIDGITEDSQQRLWMAGRYKGLQVYDKKQNQFYNFSFNPAREGTIADNKVNCVFIDGHNNLWIGTDKGISMSSLTQQFAQQFLPAAANSDARIKTYDFFVDKNKTTWIAVSSGIYTKKNTELVFQHMPVSYKGEKLAVTKFYKDDDGTMYFGTNYSLFRYNAVARTIELLPNTEKDNVMNRIIESRVVSIIRDTIKGHPALLVSPYGHFLAYYDLVEKKWISRLDSTEKIVSSFNLTDNLIRKFHRSNDGGIWLATVKEGLGYWNKRSNPSVQYFKNDPSDISSLANNNVYDMATDNKGNLWVTTNGGGLHYFNTGEKKFTHIASSANLVEGVQTDGTGNVWMIAEGNLHRYNPVTGTYTTFELPDIEKSGGVKGYIYKDAEGQLYVSGDNYFITVQPATIKEKLEEPAVIFTDFKVFNKSFSHLLFEKKIALKYTQNFFTIEFAAPFYSGSNRIHYSYMLEGVDKDWVDGGARNFASYPNTGNGNFIFKVKASVGNGKWTENITSIRIEVIPPFWKTGWFYTMCALLLAVAAYLIYRYRVNELLKRQAIRNKIAQDLHDSVGSTLSSISVYSQVAQIQSKKGNTEELSEVLDKIGNTSNDMISEMNDIVWAINPRNDSMEKIIQRMESFARPLAAARNIRFELVCDKGIGTLQLDMDKRKNFYLIFKEAVTNAIKYSGASELLADIQLRGNTLVLKVNDNGVGFNPDNELSGKTASLSGNGLRNMHTRTIELNGHLEIQSEPGQSTVITLQFSIT